MIRTRREEDSKDTRSSLPWYQQKKPNCIAFHSFSTLFSYKWAGNRSVYSMKSMFWTNKKLSLMLAWSSSVSISCFKVQSSIGHLVCFFDSGNSIVSGANLWCPWQVQLDKAPHLCVSVLFLDLVIRYFLSAQPISYKWLLIASTTGLGTHFSINNRFWVPKQTLRLV